MQVDRDLAFQISGALIKNDCLNCFRPDVLCNRKRATCQEGERATYSYSCIADRCIWIVYVSPQFI